MAIQKMPLSDWPKRRTGPLEKWITICRTLRSKAYRVWTTHNLRDPEFQIDECRSTFQIDDFQVDIPDRRFTDRRIQIDDFQIVIYSDRRFPDRHFSDRRIRIDIPDGIAIGNSDS